MIHLITMTLGFFHLLWPKSVCLGWYSSPSTYRSTFGGGPRSFRLLSLSSSSFILLVRKKGWEDPSSSDDTLAEYGKVSRTRNNKRRRTPNDIKTTIPVTEDAVGRANQPNDNNEDEVENEEEEKETEEDDTIRVQIWRVLAIAWTLKDGEWTSLKELAKAIGNNNSNNNSNNAKDLRYHLKHVARQAETIQNKSNQWRKRRGLPVIEEDDEEEKVDRTHSTTTATTTKKKNPMNNHKLTKLRLAMRNGKRRHEIFVRLE